jgi:MFS family permease
MYRKAIIKINSIRKFEKNLLLLFIAGTIGVFGLQLLQPLFPVFLNSIGASELEISYVISLSSIIGTLLMFSAGYFINKLGEKKMLLTGLFLWAFSTLLIAFTKNWRTVAFYYIFHGIAEALAGPARMLIISSLSTESNEATIFSLMSLDWLIGGTIGPPISGYLADTFGWYLPLLMASLAFFISIFPVRILDNRTFKNQTEEKSTLNFKINNNTVFFFTFGFLTLSAQSIIGTVLPLFLKSELNISTTLVGLFFTAANLMSILVQVPGGLIADRYGKKKIITLLLFPIPLVLVLWGIVNNWIGYLLIFVVFRCLFSMMGPAILALVSNIFPEEQKGSAFGLRMASVRLGSAVGPLIGSFLYSTVGPISPFIAAGFIVLISIPFIYFLR